MKRGIAIGLLSLICLISARELTAQKSAPQPLDEIMDAVEPLDSGRWIGWKNGRPSALFLLTAGALPANLGQLPSTPVAMAVSRDRVLWVGDGYRATAPLDDLQAVKVAATEGSWTMATGNARGFVISDIERLVFSSDGETWQPVEGYEISTNTRVTGLASAEDHFVALLEMSAGQPDSDYIYSILARSEDGLNWENAYFSEPYPGEPELTTIAHGQGHWMAYGIASYTSTDAREWEPTPTGRHAMPALRGAYIHGGGGEWWAEDWRDYFIFSPDGADWSAAPQYLHLLKGSGPFWSVGVEGMRNLGLDAQGKVTIRTLAAVQAGPVPPAAPPTIEYISVEAMAKKITPLTYAAGTYAFADRSGSVYFSKDAINWQSILLEKDAWFSSVRHDGEHWVVAKRERDISISKDGKAWTPFFTSRAASKTATLWQGRYWISHYLILGVRVDDYQLGRYDRGVEEKLTEWDGQLLKPHFPAVFWVEGDRLLSLRKDGLTYASENGDYWGITRGYRTSNAREIFVAEGNGLVVTFIIPEASSESKLDAYLLEGDGYNDKQATDFTTVTGLAYGAGRFVALAGTKADPKPAFFESTDGKSWKQIGATRAGLADVVYGQAGFVANAGDFILAKYHPAPLPEKPMPVREPVPVPGFTFKDFGSNFVGVGKRRQEIPKTPDQRKIDELRPAAQRAYQGDIEAGVEMAFLILDGRYALSNPWRAELWLNKGMEAGVPAAARGYAELLQQWKSETPQDVLVGLYRQSAQKGDGPAMVWLAINLPTDSAADRAEVEQWRDAATNAEPTFAARWAKRVELDSHLAAASAGNYEAIVKVLPSLVDGDIRPADWNQGLKLADLAADGGRHEPATYLLKLYQDNYQLNPGKSVFEKADYQRLLDRGAAAGYKPMFGQLLDNLMGGRFGYAKDEKRALTLARQLADQGDADGMFFVAAILQSSQGDQKDPAAAAEWMHKAAEAGHARAKQWVQMQAAGAKTK
jgi:TPR repeat protein